jgi:hypothetical protein
MPFLFLETMPNSRLSPESVLIAGILRPIGKTTLFTCWQVILNLGFLPARKPKGRPHIITFQCGNRHSFNKLTINKPQTGRSLLADL